MFYEITIISRAPGSNEKCGQQSDTFHNLTLFSKTSK